MSELRAFESVARHASFTRAAAELNLTQSAVSRQIAALEDAVGARLVLRCSGRLELSEEGREYLSGVRDALSRLDNAAGRLRERRRTGTPVNVASAPTFATQWLLSRLDRFRNAHPDVVLNFLPYTPQFDFSSPGELDVPARARHGHWLCVPREKERRPGAERFRGWLAHEARAVVG
jgi:LysR family glycine cleavage system transcriptional activator